MNQDVKKAAFRNFAKKNDILENVNIILIVLTVVIVALFQISASLGIAALKYAGGLVLLVSLFFFDTDEYPYLLMALQPIKNAATFTITSSFAVSSLNLITIIFFLQKFVFNKNYGVKPVPPRMLVPMLVLLIYSVQYMFAGNFTALADIVKTFLTAMFCVLMVTCGETEEEARQNFSMLEIYFTLGVTLSSLIAVVTNPDLITDERFSLVSGNTGVNQLGILAAFACAFVMMRMLERNTILFDVFLTLMLMGNIYVGFATESRTFATMLAVIFAWVILFGIFGGETKRERTIMYLIIMAAIIILFMIFGKGTVLYGKVEETFDRFLNPKKDDLTSERSEIWKTYIQAMLSSGQRTFFGMGNNWRSVANKMAHNMFIEMWVNYGLIGFGMIAWFYASAAKEIQIRLKAIGITKMHLYGALPLILTFAAGMTSHSLLGMSPTIEYFLGIGGLYFITYKDGGRIHENSLDNGKENQRAIGRKYKETF